MQTFNCRLIGEINDISLLQLAEQPSLQLQRHYVEWGCGYGMHRWCSGQEGTEPQRRQSWTE